MFPKSTFGTGTAGGSAFGASSPFGGTQPAFGQPAATSATPAFGAAAPAFGAPTAQPGGLFGSSTSTGGLFGSTATQPAAVSAAPFTGFGASTGTFGTNSAFRPPASNFGSTATNTFGATPGTSTGLFGATTQPTSGGLFGTTQPSTTGFGASTAFGANTNTAFALNSGQQVVGTTIKFNPPTGNDTMMKSGTQQSIQTRHLCITCMKEYENKSIEELRCEDYAANRKGGAASGTTGLFGAAPNQTAPGGSTLFGANAAVSQANPFGAQTNKPLFGAQTTAAGFGTAATAPFGAQGTSAFGTNTSTSGGLFGAKPQTSFGQAASTSGFAFGQNTATSSAAGSLFGQNKPFGAAAPQATGGLFGSTAPAFGATTSAAPAFGGTTSAFGQPAAQNQSINLFGQQNKPAAFAAPFGQTAPTTSAPAFNTGFGQSTGTFGSTAPFGQQAKPAFGGFGTTATSAAPAFGATQTAGGFGATNVQQQPAGGLFGAQKPGAFNFNSTSQPSSGALPFGGTSGGFGTTAGGGLFGNAQKPGGLFGATQGTTGAFGTTGGFGATSAGGFGATLGGGFGAAAAPFNNFGPAASNPLQKQNQNPAQADMSVHDYVASLTANPYGDDPLFKNLVPGSQSDSHLEEMLKPTNPAAQKALLLAGNQYKISPHRNVRVKPKPILSSLGSNVTQVKSGVSFNSNSPLFDGLEDDDISSKSDLFVPRRSVKKLVIKPKSPGHQTNSLDTRQSSHPGQQTINNITNDESVSEGIENAADDTTNKVDDVSLNLPPITGKDGLLSNGISPPPRLVDGSFLDTRTKKTIAPLSTSISPATLASSLPTTTSTPVAPTTERSVRNKNLNVGKSSDTESNIKKPNPSVHICSSEESVLYNDSDNDSDEPDGEDDDLNDQCNHPAKIQLKRSQYYTLPKFSELANITDKNGDCIVENFVIGRAGYGNIFFPGMTNIAGMNFDELVIFRHKEVFVYPDDNLKPILGEGLNKKAQVTLDKVWPIDKTLQNPIKSPEKLGDMNYEEKLRKACIKMGAQFVEYRPETGSWVFKVDHFSKYGLQDSDDEEDGTISSKKAPEGKPWYFVVKYCS